MKQKIKSSKFMCDFTVDKFIRRCIDEKMRTNEHLSNHSIATPNLNILCIVKTRGLLNGLTL